MPWRLSGPSSSSASPARRAESIRRPSAARLKARRQAPRIPQGAPVCPARRPRRAFISGRPFPAAALRAGRVLSGSLPGPGAGPDRRDSVEELPVRRHAHSPLAPPVLAGRAPCQRAATRPGWLGRPHSAPASRSSWIPHLPARAAAAGASLLACLTVCDLPPRRPSPNPADSLNGVPDRQGLNGLNGLGALVVRGTLLGVTPRPIFARAFGILKERREVRWVMRTSRAHGARHVWCVSVPHCDAVPVSRPPQRQRRLPPPLLEPPQLLRSSSRASRTRTRSGWPRACNPSERSAAMLAR